MRTRNAVYIPRGKDTTGSGRGGFTLLELLVALFIFALLGGTIYMVIRSSTDAYRKGNSSMEIYQSVRVGLDRMLTDLRRAVSSESIWNNQPKDEEDVEDTIDQASGIDTGPQRDEERVIRFEGTGQQVKFVTEDVRLRSGGPGFDLREIVYRVDEEKKELVKEIRDSIIQRRLNEMRAERTENETEYRAAYPEEFGSSGESERIVIANNVTAISLSYYDGQEWKQEWNSEREYRRDGYDEGYRYPRDDRSEEEAQEGPKERYGLPDAVAVTLTITNGDVVTAITEIPGRDMDIMLAINETPFLRRWWGEVGAYNDEVGYGPR
jgi:prepilin-type N-terminal cleavage/methylation domain-containing protein